MHRCINLGAHNTQVLWRSFEEEESKRNRVCEEHFFFFDLFIYPEESRYMMNGFRLSPAVGLHFHSII